MPRKRSEKPRRRIGVYIEEDLILRFHTHYKKERALEKAQYGDFTQLLNDLLRTHLSELDTKVERMEDRYKWS